MTHQVHHHKISLHKAFRTGVLACFFLLILITALCMVISVNSFFNTRDISFMGWITESKEAIYFWIFLSCVALLGFVSYIDNENSHSEGRILFGWMYQDDSSARAQQLSTMLEVLAMHNMQAYMYSPDVDHQKGEELSMVLTWLAGHGFLVTDKTGAVIGTASAAAPDNAELEQVSTYQLKLVQPATTPD